VPVREEIILQVPDVILQAYTPAFSVLPVGIKAAEAGVVVTMSDQRRRASPAAAWMPCSRWCILDPT
jgi:hypothetical protein